MSEYMDTLIREAVRFLERRPGGWVSLTRLREHIPAIPRQTVDATLIELDRNSTDVYLVPESNQKALTADDRAAALHIGGEPYHLIAVKPR